ncbi:hypothetical protein [Pararhodonellum marinum]|uniref:hypothetical protein n=1 Tax=Pararhodonellum marinum TaxID=2755358 RepID=UPI001E297DE7|nr:hypothetical protein [Pararhodonellum marinum]
MRSILTQILIGILLIFLFTACQIQSDYEKVKQKELASGEIHNELFLDIHFGMTRKDFYVTCWEHNKNGILRDGANALRIQYKPEVSSGKEVNMFFYPKFEDDKIYYMPMEFKYPAWLPNHTDFTNDLLLEDVIALLESWYGEGFFEVTNKQKTQKAWVKIDGNRHIRVFILNLSIVRAEILDLNVKDYSDLMNHDQNQ